MVSRSKSVCLRTLGWIGAVGLLLALPLALRAQVPCEDCPWLDVAQKMEADVQAGQPVLSRLRLELPELHLRMLADAHRKPSWLGLWGRSINFDEFAKGIIVDPKVIDTFMKLFHPPTGPSVMIDGRQIVHAGVEHTYGYLFSNLKTAFGYKRARWIRNSLDRGFDFPEATIAPIPAKGTLFSNVTYFAGQVAFRNEKQPLTVLATGLQGVSPVVRGFDYSTLSPTRLEETIQTADGNVVIRTDFVPFLKKVEGDTNSQMLIYSILDQRKGASALPVLITVFPVENGFVQAALNPENLGENKPIITRYNAYVDGITGGNFTGTRKKL